MTPTPPLADDRLRLEPLRVDHADEMVAVLADAGLFTFTGGSPPTLDELRQRYGRQVAGSGEPANRWHTWVVRLGDGGPAVGFVQATVLVADGTAELSWVVGSAWQGRGVARGAATLVRDAVVAAGARRVVAHVHPDHLASQRVARALGLSATERLVDGEVEWLLEVEASRR